MLQIPFHSGINVVPKVSGAVNKLQPPPSSQFPRVRFVAKTLAFACWKASETQTHARTLTRPHFRMHNQSETLDYARLLTKWVSECTRRRQITRWLAAKTCWSHTVSRSAPRRPRIMTECDRGPVWELLAGSRLGLWTDLYTWNFTH